MIAKRRMLNARQLAPVWGVTYRQAIRRLKASPNAIRTRGPGGHGGDNYALPFDSLPSPLQEQARQLFPDLAAEPEPPVPADASGRALVEAPAAPSARRRRRSDFRKARPWPPPRKRAALGLSSESARAIDHELRKKGRALLNTGIAQRRAAEYLSLDAFDLCRAHGCTLPEAQLRKLCNISRAFVKHLWPGPYLPKMVTDAKTWADRQPGILRDWSLLKAPLEVVISDVTPLDLRFLRPDGTEPKLRLIASLDGKTRRLFVHVFKPDLGTGVRMEHVAAHIADLCLTVGTPDHWYIDRGGEFNCADLIAHLTTIHRSLPYNARAKPIEPAFKALLRFIAEIPGFIGSDRMRKKTQSVGRPANPFPGTLEELRRAVLAAVAHYNATPKDALGGLSPDDAWQQASNAGWQPARAAERDLAEALCRRIERIVTRGCIHMDNAAYTSEELIRRADLEGRKVTVAKSLFSFPPLLFDPSGECVGRLYEDVSADAKLTRAADVKLAHL